MNKLKTEHVILKHPMWLTENVYYHSAQTNIPSNYETDLRF